MRPNALKVAGRGFADFHWHRFDQTESANAPPLDVSNDTLLENRWCSIQRVSIGAAPHIFRFCRPRHTLMIFDRGSFVKGERRIDGVRIGASGPLDGGVDVAPANMEFLGLAEPGSNITCTLITIDSEETGDVFGICAHEHPRLRPAINVGGELLLPLTARLRQLCRGRADHIDSLHLETVTELLFREVLLAQEGDHVGRPARCAGGLSSHTQRIVRDFLVENLEQKIDLDTLANQVGLSRFHFTRAFKTSFGIPPYKYLLNLRIREAADSLRNTRLPITDIALNVGFSCSSEFARAFRQAMGCTPREFRLLNR